MPEQTGFLLVDKPVGITSFDVIYRLRKVTGIRRIGHTGTLDPFATGLLVVCLGKFTRLAQFIEAENKTYEAEITLGTQTDTADLTGAVIQSLPLPDILPDLEKLISAVLALESLPVPAYSAIKLDGRRAYDYARKGENPQMPARRVRIDSFELLEYSPEKISYRCTVSKGTYIRSLSEWIASRLGTCGHTSKLRRTAIGKSKVDSAFTLDHLEQNWTPELLSQTPNLLASLPQLVLTAEDITLLNHGRTIPSAGLDSETILVLSPTQQIIGIASRKENVLTPRINL